MSKTPKYKYTFHWKDKRGVSRSSTEFANNEQEAKKGFRRYWSLKRIPNGTRITKTKVNPKRYNARRPRMRLFREGYRFG